MDIVSERFSARPEEVVQEALVPDYHEAIAARYPTKEASELLTPQQTLLKLQELKRLDQEDRTDDKAFERKMQREQESGIDEDAQRRQVLAELVHNGSLDALLADPQISDKDKSFALNGAAWYLFQHSGAMEDIGIAIQLASAGLTHMTDEVIAQEKQESGSIKSIEEIRTFNLKRSIDRYLIFYQQQRQQLSDITAAVQIFGTNSFAPLGVEMKVNPLADKAEDLERLFAQDPQHFATRILAIFK